MMLSSIILLAVGVCFRPGATEVVIAPDACQVVRVAADEAKKAGFRNFRARAGEGPDRRISVDTVVDKNRRRSKAPVKTYANVWKTATHLHLSFDCEEPEMEKTLAKKRAFADMLASLDNMAGVAFCPKGRRTGDLAQIFLTSAGGVSGCYMTHVDRKWKTVADWAPEVVSSVERTPTGWKGTFAIPLAALPPLPDEMPMNFLRTRALKTGTTLILWGDYPDYYSDHSQFGIVEFRESVSPAAPEVRPAADGGFRLYRPGAAEPFATCAPAPEGTSLEVRTEPGSPFVYFDVAPAVQSAGRTVGRLDLPRVTLAPFATKPKAMSNAGLTEVDGHSGALGFIAIAEPGTRRGVVAAWITNERASGVVGSSFAAGGGVVLEPFAEYGRMLVKGGATVLPDTFAIGAFDDCRLGLEAYADAAARRAGVKLPPQIAGYTTWYPDRFGYSDRSKYAKGCGAGDEASTKAFADEIVRLNLGAYGFSFFQIDDQWQLGEELKGPARNFTATDPKGPYPRGFRPTTDYLAARGIRAGLWWIPFGGMSCDPWWADKSNLYVRVASDVKGGAATIERGHTPDQRRGAPFETVWGGTCLDMTNPEARRYIAETTRRMTYDWGMGYIKYDGMWTGYAADLAGGKSWKDDHFGNAVFADPTVPNVAAYRLGVKTMREAAKPGTFILGCNIAQNARSIVASFGLADGMRIGGDNGPIDMFPDRYDKGPKAASNLYFLNGRLWYNDPDPVYVRNAVPLGRARTFASFTALAGALYNFSDWLPDLKPERVEILKRTMAPHGIRAARPIDYFETELPTAWIVDGGETKVFGLYNWNTNRAARVDFAAGYAGLDPAKTYVGFDFWKDAFVPPFKGRLAAEIPADDCRVLAVREVGSRPFVLSTSRHVASPLFDVTDERWDAATRTLSGVSKAVRGERYELRLWAPDGFRCVSAGAGRVVQSGNEVRVAFAEGLPQRAWAVTFGVGR